MTGIGMLVQTPSGVGYAYKIKGPPNSLEDNIIDLSGVINLQTTPTGVGDMSDGILMVHNGQLVIVSADALRDLIINQYIVAVYPENTIFVGSNPVYASDLLIEVN